MERAVLDTSAILTLFTALKLKGSKLEELEIVVPSCVKGELENFTKHSDYLGKRASFALNKITVVDNPLSEDELKDERGRLGLKEERITDCDIQSLHLSFKLDLPFFTDDFSAHRHFTIHYPSKNLYYGIILALDVLGFNTSTEANDFIFNELLPKRFPQISDRTKSNIKTAIDEYLSPNR
ncbi:hypothetical protein AKJ44_00435 [candidate division MSBL1 archaeon SCGC-AAA261F17]|uniref:PIN domain-containing protein n=1 Tax=candidate division MSBL1 archaeon SCGC-AAA261F17 TaxID=1698274 RepID=A0A133V7T0_9EURY|nr:hypothetical protein AKJ44_00435 [candidate division MSBL1 archaeon SCGC-AAA261F17]